MRPSLCNFRCTHDFTSSSRFIYIRSLSLSLVSCWPDFLWSTRNMIIEISSSLRRLIFGITFSAAEEAETARRDSVLKIDVARRDALRQKQPLELVGSWFGRRSCCCRCCCWSTMLEINKSWNDKISLSPNYILISLRTFLPTKSQLSLFESSTRNFYLFNLSIVWSLKWMATLLRTWSSFQSKASRTGRDLETYLSSFTWVGTVNQIEFLTIQVVVVVVDVSLAVRCL